jgi:hypothetical protein
MGFEPTIPVFERAKRVHASDRAATVLGRILILCIAQIHQVIIFSLKCYVMLSIFLLLPHLSEVQVSYWAFWGLLITLGAIPVLSLLQRILNACEAGVRGRHPQHELPQQCVLLARWESKRSRGQDSVRACETLHGAVSESNGPSDWIKLGRYLFG